MVEITLSKGLVSVSRMNDRVMSVKLGRGETAVNIMRIRSSSGL